MRVTKDVMLNLRITKHQADQAFRLAKHLNISFSGLVRSLLAESIGKHNLPEPEIAVEPPVIYSWSFDVRM